MGSADNAKGLADAGTNTEPLQGFAYLGRLAYETGWKCQAVTATLEKRKKKAQIHCRKEKQLTKLWKQAEKNVEKKTELHRGP